MGFWILITLTQPGWALRAFAVGSTEPSTASTVFIGQTGGWEFGVQPLASVPDQVGSIGVAVIPQ